MAVLLCLALIVVAPVSAEAQAAPEPAVEQVESEANEDTVVTGDEAPSALDGDTETIRIIAVVDSMTSVDTVSADLADVADEVIRLDRLDIVAYDIVPSEVGRLAANPHVRSIHENTEMRPMLDTTVGLVGADVAHARGYTGAGTTIAIFDTGIDDSHPFVADSIVAELCYSMPQGADEFSLCPGGVDIGDDAAVNDNPACLAPDGGALCSHGTWVAGIAAGSFDADPANAPANGIAPDASLIPIQIFTGISDPARCGGADRCTTTYALNQLAAINALLDLNDANPDWNLVAANFSLGGGVVPSGACDGEIVAAGFADLLAEGIVPVVAAGNQGQVGLATPACITGAVAVGNSTDADTLDSTSNRSVDLDLFAPGVDIISSEQGGGYTASPGSGGTSASAPHVAGALAVLRQALPDAPVGDLVDLLIDTGVPITFDVDGTSVTRPRISLDAALDAAVPEQPTIIVDQSVIVADEGATVTNSGTFTSPGSATVDISASSGTAVITGEGTWSWTDVAGDGPSETIVTVTVTTATGRSASVDFVVQVVNVAPDLTVATPDPTDEGATVTIEATFTDGGDDGPYAVDVDPGSTLARLDDVVVSVDDGGGLAMGTITITIIYGDNGAFPAAVTVTDADGAASSVTVDATVLNVDPGIDLVVEGTVDIGGTETLIARVNETLDFPADLGDPGSDDLTVTWDFGDGTVTEQISLVAPPDPDPFPSPSIDPRDLVLSASHTYLEACLYTVTVDVVDDDGGLGDDELAVVVLGDSTQVRSKGFWKQVFVRGAKRSADEPACLLAIVNYLSTVFSEAVPASTDGAAAAVLGNTGAGGSATAKFDAQLLALWLNVADGSVALDEPTPSRLETVGDLLSRAEAARLDPGTSRSEILRLKDELELINVSDG